MHIYDDLEVVSQSRQSSDCSPEMLKFGPQQHQTLSGLVQHQSQLNKHAGGRQQQQTIYASTRELYEPTTKLVIGSSGQQQQQQQQNSSRQSQQQARAKFYKELAEDEFYDE